MNAQTATARPWILCEEKKRREQWATDGISLKAYKREYDDYCAFAILRGGINIKDDLANAALIVRAVNSHDALVEALELVAQCAVNRDTIAPDFWIHERVKAALKLARGEV